MPDPGWGTRVRDGSPSTVDVTGPMVEVLLGPTAFTWLGPVFELFSPYTTNTADLCATDPPQPENWGWADLMGALSHTNDAYYTAKLIRMTAAYLWPAYCEYYVLDPVDPTGVGGDPLYLGMETDEWPNGFDFSGGSINVQRQFPDADFLLFRTERRPDNTITGVYPRIYFANATQDAQGYWNDWVYGAALPIWNLDGSEKLTLIHQGTPEVHFEYPFDSFDGTSGAGYWRVQAWAWKWVGGPARPPLVPRWETPPALPAEFQFSDTEKATLVLMGQEWPEHRNRGAQVAGLIGATQQLVLNNYEILLALLADLTAPPGFDYVVGPSWTVPDGGGLVETPGDAVGVIILFGVEDFVASFGVEPITIPRAGWYAIGTSEGWEPSQPIKHDQQRVYPLPARHNRLSVEFSNGVAGHVEWIRQVPIA